MRWISPRFLPALVLAVASLASAPFMGLLRDALFSWLGTAAVRTLAAVIAAVALAAFAVAVARIRERRLARYGLLLGVMAMLAFQTVGLGTGDAEVDVVEKVHILQYGLLAALFYWALALPGREAEVPALVLPLLWAALTGVAEESVQGYFRLRVGDVRDVALNATAALNGLLFAVALAPPEALRRARPETWRRVARWAASLVLAAGLFFDAVHLGHMIEDPEIGRFRSWFTAEQLDRLAADRARRWAEERPVFGVPWHKKDYYVVEAASHAGHRNRAYADGHWTFAWHANLILERYYAPFLDLDSFRGAGRHRYPEATRRQLEAKARSDPEGYLSPVQSDRVFPWPRGPFYAFVLGLAGFVFAVPTWLAGRAESAP